MSLFRRCAFLILLCFTALPVSAQTTSTPTTTAEKNESYEQAIVENVELLGTTDQTGAGSQVEVYRVKFTSGPLKNQSREIKNEVESNPYRIALEVGDRLIMLVQTNPDGTAAFYIEGYDRQTAIIWLIIAFVATMVLLSGWQGLKVAFSIGISIALIGYVLIPLFLRGVNPVPVAIILGGVLTLISTTFSTGWNKKSYVTVIGTIGGTLVAYAVSVFFANWAHLNGLSSEEDRLFFGNNPTLSARGLLFAGIIIASVGVVEDVAVSIASGVAEIRRRSPQTSVYQLFRSGMTIGNDHMAALANTLVFAYVGASLSSLLLYQQFGSSWLKFVNFDTVVDEIVRSLSGTIGLAFTVPITALLAAWVMAHTKPSEQQNENHLHTHHH